MTRRLQHDQLVAADTGMPIRQCARALGPDRKSAAAGIEHDKVVAEAVHLQKRHLSHSAAYMAAPPALSNFRSVTEATRVLRYPFLAADLAAACRALDLPGLAIPALSDFAFGGFVVLPVVRGDLRGAPTNAILVLFALAT
jgi:hypothetical protein